MLNLLDNGVRKFVAYGVLRTAAKTPEQKRLLPLVESIMRDGLHVFVNEGSFLRYTYGFYTDDEGSHIVVFHLPQPGFRFALSGCYVTDNPVAVGSGWEICALPADLSEVPPGWFRRALGLAPPYWITEQVKWWRHKTLAEYLREYQSSSKFVKICSGSSCRDSRA